MPNDLIAVRLTESEVTYLEGVAKRHLLTKKDGSPSLGLAIKQLVKASMRGKDAAQSQDVSIKLDHLTAMLEQVNSAIPHLVYNTSFNYKINAGQIKEDTVFAKCKQAAVDLTRSTCGQIQKQDYNTLFIAKDAKNMTVIPIEEGENQWK